MFNPVDIGEINLSFKPPEFRVYLFDLARGIREKENGKKVYLIHNIQGDR